MEQSGKEIKSLQKKAAIRCWNPTCNKVNVSKRCGKCHDSYYCSAECQKAHWPFHKEMCTLIAKTRKSLKEQDKTHDVDGNLIKDSKNLRKDLRNIYQRWKLPRQNKISLLADFLLPGDMWRTHFLFLPILLKVGSNGEEIVELEINAWQYFNIHDNKEDSANIYSNYVPLNDFRQQIIAYRKAVPENLQNFRQAQIVVWLVDNTTKAIYSAYMAMGINAGSVPGVENAKIFKESVIIGIVNSLNNTPWDYIPNDDDYEWRQWL